MSPGGGLLIWLFTIGLACLFMDTFYISSCSRREIGSRTFHTMNHAASYIDGLQASTIVPDLLRFSSIRLRPPISTWASLTTFAPLCQSSHCRQWGQTQRSRVATSLSIYSSPISFFPHPQAPRRVRLLRLGIMGKAQQGELRPQSVCHSTTAHGDW